MFEYLVPPGYRGVYYYRAYAVNEEEYPTDQPSILRPLMKVKGMDGLMDMK